jgi:uncharacterized protein YyaL (SSP411 family)
MSSTPSGRAPNRLARASSPYLLLHRFNPVDWYEWGEEAIERARREEKPIFLSVGYSTCYWCHVMERESFADAATAERMNRDFVNIKLDREERPELDEIYMTATQLLTGQGGWPNSVFLTPGLEPFFAGTYFPPDDRHGRPGFPALLEAVAKAWKTRRPELEGQAKEIAAAMRRYLEERARPGRRPPAADAADRSYAALARRFDAAWGGFGSAPKFPTPSNLFLLHELAGERAEAGAMLARTLEAMVRGGICDQLGGGFHRYATDRQWNVPHFEKMLYDNGLLLELLAREHARTGEPEMARAARETADFIGRELTAPEGGVWSAIDAETEGEEGAFYVWRRAELEAALGPEDAQFLAPLYGFDGPPFFEGDRYVLHLPRPIAEQAAVRRTDAPALWAQIGPLRARLFDARAARPRPLTDDKVLAEWNGMAISGLATAGRLLEIPALSRRAARAAEFVLGALRPDGVLLRSWRAGTAGETPAFLADYAFLIRGLLALHDATADARWLDAAVELAREQRQRLGDPEGGYFTAAARPDVLMRSKEVFDGAVPAANAVAVLNLLDLGERTGGAEWGEEAERALKASADLVDVQVEAARTFTVAARRWGRRTGTAAAPLEVAAPASPAPPWSEEAGRVVAAALRVDPAGEGDWQAFELRVTVAPGWHVQSHAAPEDRVATILVGEGCELRGLRYPEGVFWRGVGRGDVLRVYEEEFTIAGRLRRDAPRAVLRLTYQPCDAARCLPAVTLEVPVG